MKYLLILMLWLDSGLALSQGYAMLTVVLEQAAVEHMMTDRMERLQKEVFAELEIEKQYPMYFVDARGLLSMTIEGVCFPAHGRVILVDTQQFNNPKYTDMSIKLTMAHEILHCYAGEPHKPEMVAMNQVMSGGDIYRYKGLFAYIDFVIDELLGVDMCPASLMFPNGAYDEVCGPYMYEIYMSEAREALRRK